MGVEPACGHGFIRVQVHHPVAEPSAPQSHIQGSNERDDGRGSEGDHQVLPGQAHQFEAAGNDEGGKINDPGELGPLAESRVGNAVNPDAAPGFAFWEKLCWVVISAAAGHHGHLVTRLLQPYRQVLEMLGRGNQVGIESLIDQCDAHLVHSFSENSNHENLSLARKAKLKGSRYGKMLERKLLGIIEAIPEAVW